MICIECKQPHVAGVCFQRTIHQSLEWVCRQCFDDHDYGRFMKGKVTVDESGTRS